MRTARVVVVDGHRHRQASGYGELVRAILIALSKSRHFEVSILPGGPPFEDIGSQRERVANLPVIKSPEKADVILQVGQPSNWIRYSRPTALYTMFDTSRLPAGELSSMRAHDADLVFVPNQFNKRYLDPYFPDVRVVPPILDPQLFRPRPPKRPVAGRELTFLFQGGFGYRKGVDILLEAFTSEFRAGEARLHLHCSNLHIRHANMMLRALAGRPSPPVIELYHKTYHREWMANFYNAADAFVSLTRAEAWGLPITEALLCGRPVVTSRDFGMAEYLPRDYAYFVEGERRLLADIKEPFGVDWRDRHAEPGSEYFEASVADARAKMRAVVEEPWKAEIEADRARSHLLAEFGPAHAQRLLIRGLRDLVKGRISRAA